MWSFLRTKNIRYLAFGQTEVVWVQEIFVEIYSVYMESKPKIVNFFASDFIQINLVRIEDKDRVGENKSLNTLASNG